MGFSLWLSPAHQFPWPGPIVAPKARGLTRAASEFACDYAARREAFGGSIIKNRGVPLALADMFAESDAPRLLTWRAAWMAAQGVFIPAC
jgi:acyl-CoA dehydrogenase